MAYATILGMSPGRRLTRDARRASFGGAQRAGQLVLAAVACLWLVGCNQPRVLAIRSMNEGLEAQKRGELRESLERLGDAARHDPTYAEPHYFAAQLHHLKANDLDSAERAYRQALEIEPENAQIAYRLGWVLADKGQHEQALAMYAKSTTVAPEFSRAWFRLGMSQEALGRYTDAVESYGRSIRTNARMKMDGDDPGGAAYHALGDLYIRYNLNERAIKVYENGLVNNSGLTRLLYGRGVAQLNLERYREAAATFEEVLKQQPRHAPATLALARTQVELGQKPAAIEILEQYIRMGGTSEEDQARQMAAHGLLQRLRE